MEKKRYISAVKKYFNCRISIQKPYFDQISLKDGTISYIHTHIAKQMINYFFLFRLRDELTYLKDV